MSLRPQACIIDCSECKRRSLTWLLYQLMVIQNVSYTVQCMQDTVVPSRYICSVRCRVLMTQCDFLWYILSIYSSAQPVRCMINNDGT